MNNQQMADAALDRLKRHFAAIESEATCKDSPYWADDTRRWTVLFSAMSNDQVTLSDEYMDLRDATLIAKESLTAMGCELKAWIPGKEAVVTDRFVHHDNKNVRVVLLDGEKLSVEYHDDYGWHVAAPQPRTIGELRQLMAMMKKGD